MASSSKLGLSLHHLDLFIVKDINKKKIINIPPEAKRFSLTDSQLVEQHSKEALIKDTIWLRSLVVYLFQKCELYQNILCISKD